VHVAEDDVHPLACANPVVFHAYVYGENPPEGVAVNVTWYPESMDADVGFKDTVGALSTFTGLLAGDVAVAGVVALSETFISK
jgi:hypothetical protein